MRFNKRSGLILIISVIICSIISVIVISWGSYTLKGYYKLPINSNAASILAGITGMWGSILGGVIGGFLTLAGVLLTIDRERKNNIIIHFRSQLGAAIFLSLVIGDLMKNIKGANYAIEKVLETGMLYGVTTREDLYKTLSYKFIDRSYDWATYIDKIQDVNLQKDLWIIYKRFIEIEEKVYCDTSDLHKEKEEILSELPDNYLEIASEVLTPRQRIIIKRLNLLNAKLEVFETMRQSEWKNFENNDYLYQVDLINVRLSKLIDDIQYLNKSHDLGEFRGH